MRPMPKKLRDQISADPFMSKCARSLEGNCDGRITWEHALIFAGKQLNERFAIIPLCEKHHAVNKYQDGDHLCKEINVLIALNRATDSELDSISKVEDYRRKREYLRDKYPDYA
jgi:hypothetical protein